MTHPNGSTNGGGHNTDARHWSDLKTEYRWVDPKTGKRQELNARYMEPAQFALLVENIKKDGKLTSVPLWYENPNGELEIISGHHRTLAATEAGLEQIMVEVILTPLSPERLKALQLSHNAISGKDNLAVLGSMWANLSLDAKKYSGLTEDDLGEFGDIKIAGIGAQGIRYEELTLMFLPSDLETVEERLKTIKASETKVPNVKIAAIESFEEFFDTVVRTKEITGVVNNALAFATMLELATQRLDQLEAEQAAEREAEEAEKSKANGHDKSAANGKAKANGKSKKH